MKNTCSAILVTIALSTPLVAIASDEEVTIRVMEQHEYSADKMIQLIELPSAASDKASEHGQPGQREQERNREHSEEHEMEQERIMERDQDHESQHEQNEIENEAIERRQQGPGRD
jgi:hypothetical protein